MYLRVRDRQTRHQYDILSTTFDPELHEEVKRGPVKGLSSIPRATKHYVAKGETPGPADAAVTPVGSETPDESEDPFDEDETDPQDAPNEGDTNSGDPSGDTSNTTQKEE
jgi:hypothetical protein